MHKSLTIILPVRNAQASLQLQVDHILEFLPEITPDFEILIVDDASTDMTEDIAIDLARHYPQVRILRQSEPRGHAAAVEAGLARTTGEIVFVSDPGVPVTEADVQRLWKMRDDRELVMARTHVAPRPLDQSLLQRLMAWGEAVRSARTTSSASGSLQMIRRGAIESLTQVDQPEKALTVDRDTEADTVRILSQPSRPVPSAPVFAPAMEQPHDFSPDSHLSYF